MTSPSLTFDRPPPAWWRLGPALWLAAALLLVFAYLLFNIPGSWFGGGAPQNYPGAAMTILTGIGQPESGKLVLTSADAGKPIILTLNTPHISTQQYGLIALDVEGVPDAMEVTLFWRNDLAPTKMFTRSISVAGGRIQDVMVAGDSNWLGRIHTIGLILRGTLPAPLTINGLAVKSASAASILAERWRDWTDQETWSGVSLTRIIGGRTGTELPLPLITALSAALACAGYFALRRWRKWQGSALTIAAIVLSGWMVLDVRWQVNLFSDAAASWSDFAGRDLSAKRLMGVDSEMLSVSDALRQFDTDQRRDRALFPARGNGHSLN